MKDDLVERVALAMRTRTRPVGTMLECEELARAVLAIARPAILEEAAKVAQGDVYNERYRKWLWWSKVGCRGEEDEITQFADKLAAHLRALSHTIGQEPAPTCPICAEPFKADDICATDVNEGTCHAECLEGSPVVYLDTGEPSDGPVDTFRYDRRAGGEAEV